MRFDVVIAGAGIGGAVLALDLGRRGWRVALVERESGPPRIAHPEILWGATVHALERFDLGAAIRESSVRLERLELGGPRPWFRLSEQDFAAAGVEAFSTNPAATRAIFADAALGTGNVELFRGVAVDELLRDDGHVTGVRGKRGEESVAFEAVLVVGDDGGNSMVRKQLGIPIELQPFPVDFVAARLPRWPLPPSGARGWIVPGEFGRSIAAAVFIPWPRNEGVLLMPLPPALAKQTFEQPAENFWRALERVTPLAPAVREQLEFARDFVRVARPFGHVASYVVDGAALIGDAAHQMTPVGGQGANASIWDALALAEVADAALRRQDLSREQLLPYERLRRPINDRSVSFSRIARRVMRSSRFMPLSVVVPLFARTIDLVRAAPRMALRTASTTFVHPAGAAKT
jgi:2-polyprenyl-6-methoxyphenol hydroxylase-like FAD-dependent oxidoreductase